MPYKNKTLLRAAQRRYYWKHHEEILQKQRANRPVKPRKTRLERFLRFVHFNTKTGCWDWLGKRTMKGYGHFDSGKRAHRIAWILFRGAWPEGKEADHLCRNTSCANPFHIEPVTRRENLIRQAISNGWTLRKLAS